MQSDATNMIPAPHLDYATLAPLLIVFGGACLAVLFEAVVRSGARVAVQLVTAGATLVAAFVALVLNWRAGRFSIVGNGLLAADRPAYLMQGALIIFTVLSLLLFTAHHRRVVEAEIYAFGLFSLFGMMLFVSSTNLVMLFVALEVLSLPLYVLTALSRHHIRRSQEAALKYFLLGVLAAAVMLYGVVLIFAATGSLDYRDIPNGSGPMLMLGVVFVVIGLLFKIGAVPFHSWVPDVYQGAPTGVTAFMAICTKLAAIAALLRLLTLVMPLSAAQWKGIVMTLAVISMAVGALLSMIQDDVKRVIAYSSISHAGFLLTAAVGASTGEHTLGGVKVSATSGMLIYLLAYGLATIAAFGVVSLVRREGQEATDLASWRGLGRRHPWLGVAFAVAFLSFAGFPLTAGFIGKLAVFAVPWLVGQAWLVVVALIVAAIATYAYVRVLVIMFFGEPREGVSMVRPGVFVGLTIFLAAVGTVLLGILPGTVLDLAAQVGGYLV